MNDEHGGGASRTTDPASGSSAATDVSLREYVHMQIGYERQSTRMLVGFAVSLGAFAWSQIQRRLEILNHENARVAQVIDKTVSADTYLSDETRRNDERTKTDDWRSKVDARLNEAATKEEVKADVKTDRRASLDTGTRLAQIAIVLLAFGLSILSYQLLKHTPSAPAVVTVTVPTTTTP